MRMHYLQHVSFESPGNITDYFSEKGWVVSGSQLYMQDFLPTPDDFDLLLVMGGPMGVYDEDTLPWMTQEKALIRSTIRSGKKVIGICLGAQLIAESLGAKVYPGPVKEIGWFPIQPLGHHRLIDDLMDVEEYVFHWHGDTFDIPEGAQQLFSSQPGINQGYIYQDQVLALQFHLEMTASIVEALVSHGADELVEAAYIQSSTEIIDTNIYYDRNKTLLFTLLDRFITG